MRPPGEPLFLARQSYRRRRVTDAAKLLPLVGVILWLFPVLWSSDARTGSGLIYLFAVWAALIIAMAILAGRLSRSAPDTSVQRGNADPRESDGG